MKKRERELKRLNTSFERKLIVLGTLIVIQGLDFDIQIIGRIGRVVVAVVIIGAAVVVIVVGRGRLMRSAAAAARWRRVIVVVVLAKRVRLARRLAALLLVRWRFCRIRRPSK